jgi:hypothetical protein
LRPSRVRILDSQVLLRACSLKQHLAGTPASGLVGSRGSSYATKPEQQLRDRLGVDKGYVDLKFEDRANAQSCPSMSS